VETVEKWLNPLIYLPFWLWTNCGRRASTIHTPVEKSPFPYIFALSVADSCLTAMHTLHIFCPKRRILALQQLSA